MPGTTASDEPGAEPVRGDDAGEPTPALHAPSTEGRTALWLEIGVVCAIGVFPHLLSAALGFLEPRSPPPGGWVGDLYATGYCLPLIVTVLWIMWRSGRPWREFGMTSVQGPLDVVIALGVMAACWLGSYGGAVVVVSACWMVPGLWPIIDCVPPPAEAMFERPSGTWPVVAFVIANLANGVAEELVLRGYLIPRLRTALQSVWKAVLVSSLLGASYHIYQGSYSAVVLIFAQFAIGLLFVAAPRIWPFMLGHAVYDIVLIAMYYPAAAP